jgi:lipopolysaccharide/colanic/teichoic acid biosynthesis glycosyltransferase/dTDP-4-dehydrorhamnose reductase
MQQESPFNRILITGATGFIGSAIIKTLAKSQDYFLRAAVRCDCHNIATGTETVIIENISSSTDWETALSGIDVIIHTAGRAHQPKKLTTASLSDFYEVNVAGTLNLASQASAAGIKRFLFISSIQVNGTYNDVNHPFHEDDIVKPTQPYAISKLRAERGLQQLAKETGLEVVIIRPPLVYGTKAPGNFGRLLHAINMGIPLPLGAIQNNQRTLIGLDNLVDLIITCIDHPAAANEIFLAGDNESLSTTELLRQTSNALGKKILLLPVPIPFLLFFAKLVGKKTIIYRLCNTLLIDTSKAHRLLNWNPELTIEDGLKRIAEGQVDSKDKKKQNMFLADRPYIMPKTEYKFKRLFDFILATLATILLSIPMIVIAILVKTTSKGSILYWSKRVGQNNRTFNMPKFRTMRTNTPVVATHLLTDPDRFLTWPGLFLRKTSLDELPQLFCILKGNMSFVGPRPALCNQENLNRIRTEKKIHLLTPGLTGWAQINGRDDLPIPEKVKHDEYYLNNISFWLDIKIIFLTLITIVQRKGVHH